MLEVDDIKVSVVIPVYNASKTIIQCLQSVVQQTYCDFEIVVVNDGSTDNSQVLIESFMSGISFPLKLINQENRGVSIARNTAIREAKGKYIAFLDADDVWENEKLEIQIKLMEDFPDVVLLGAGIDDMIVGKEKELYRISPFKALLRSYFDTSAVVAEKKTLVEMGLFPEDMRYSEDICLWMKVAAVYPCYYLAQSLVRRQKDSKGLSNQLVAMEKGQLKVINNTWKEKHINTLQWLFLTSFSLLKFMVRVLKKLNKA